MTKPSTPIVILDRSYVAQSGDVGIELKPGPGQRPDMNIDPQHGNHRGPHAQDCGCGKGKGCFSYGPRWPEIEDGDAACTYALRLYSSFPVSRIVIGPGAGVDDYCAAAILAFGDVMFADDVTPRSEVLYRLTDIAAYDNAASGGQVTDRYPGLGRIAASSLAPLRKAELFAQWINSGVIYLGQDDHEALLGGLLSLPQDLDMLPLITAVATAVRQRYQGLCKVMVTGGVVGVNSPVPSGDPSEGQGGFGLGYQHGDVVCAWYPLENGKRKFTIGAKPGRRYTLRFPEMMQSLCALEPGWGGNAQAVVGGSPMGGSALAPEQVLILVRAHVLDTLREEARAERARERAEAAEAAKRAEEDGDLEGAARWRRKAGIA